MTSTQKWLTQDVDAVDLVVDEVATGADAVDLAVEAAKMKRRNGALQYLSGIDNILTPLT